MRRSGGWTMKTVVLLFLAAGALVCTKETRVAEENEKQAAAMKSFTKSDQGTVQELTKGELFEVRLSENPTTGYVWEAEKKAEGLLGLEREGYEAEPADPRIVGRGGIKIFVFKTLETGSGEIDLRLRRPWMRDVFIDSFLLKIVVTEKN